MFLNFMFFLEMKRTFILSKFGFAEIRRDYGAEYTREHKPYDGERDR